MDGIKLPDAKIAFTIILIGIFSVIAFVLLVISLVGDAQVIPNNNNTVSPTQFTPNTSLDTLEKNYSKIDKIIPGKTNFAEAQKINGKASETKRTAGKTYLYYNTPVESHQNVIVVKNNIVFYSTEYVYGDYRKTVSEFKSLYGAPNLTLFDSNDGFPWDIFLKSGVGIKSDGKDVGEIVYFIPQSEQSFMKDIAPDLNLSATPSAEAN